MFQNLNHQYKKGITIIKKTSVLLFDALFIASILFLTMLAAKAVTSAPSELTITVKTDKSTYVQGDTINITLEAENLTGQDKILTFSTGCQMSFEILQYMETSKGYSLPVFNDTLYPRNCSKTPTTITIPNGKKAIWTRSINPDDSNYPELYFGKYLLHGYIKDYQNDDWSYQNSSYVNFNINYPSGGEGVMCNDTILCSNMDCVYSGIFTPDSNGICMLSSSVLKNYPTDQLCAGTGGTFNMDNKTCGCPSGSEWSDKAGCTENIFEDEICISTGGALTLLKDTGCFCGSDKQWNMLKGCQDIKVVTFNDTEGHWAQDYILSLANKGVVSGYEDGGYHPDANINRAEIVKMALSAAGIPSEDPQADVSFKFNDVSGWQTAWVYSAWKRNIVTGYSEESFAPGQNVTRAEALKIAMLAFKIDVPDTSTEWAFEDTIGHWGISYINKAYLEFIISGREEGKFFPNDPITRAEAAKIIQLLSAK